MFEVWTKEKEYEGWGAKKLKALGLSRGWHKEEGGKDIQEYESPKNLEYNLGEN